jgi:hypothetical protein
MKDTRRSRRTRPRRFGVWQGLLLCVGFFLFDTVPGHARTANAADVQQQPASDGHSEEDETGQSGSTLTLDPSGAVADNQRRLVALVLDVARASEQRHAALSELLQSNGHGVVSPSAAEAMNTVLLRVDCDYAPVIVGSFASMSVLPERLWDPFVSLLNRCEVKREIGLRAVPVFRTRAAAAYLIKHTADREPGLVRVAAFEGLERLSGRRFGTDAGAWRSWHAAMEGADEAAWIRELMQGLAIHADGLRLQRRQSVDRTLELLRRLHLRTPAEERTALLVSMLEDQEREVQRLGLRLGRGDLASGVVSVESLGLAARKLIDVVDPELRLNASVLCLQTGVGISDEMLDARLRDEVDAPVLAVLLNLYAATPTQQGLTSVVEMLDASSGDVRSAARVATIAALRSTMPVETSVRDRLIDRVHGHSAIADDVSGIVDDRLSEPIAAETDAAITPLHVAIALRFELSEFLDRLLATMSRDEPVDELVDVVARTPAGWGVVVRAAAADVRWHQLLSEFVARHGVAPDVVGRVLQRETFGSIVQHGELAVDLAELYPFQIRIGLAQQIYQRHPSSADAILATIDRDGLDAAGRQRLDELLELVMRAHDTVRAGSMTHKDSAPETDGSPSGQAGNAEPNSSEDPGDPDQPAKLDDGVTGEQSEPALGSGKDLEDDASSRL